MATLQKNGNVDQTVKMIVSNVYGKIKGSIYLSFSAISRIRLQEKWTKCCEVNEVKPHGQNDEHKMFKHKLCLSGADILIEICGVHKCS